MLRDVCVCWQLFAVTLGYCQLQVGYAGVAEQALTSMFIPLVPPGSTPSLVCRCVPLLLLVGVYFMHFLWLLPLL